MEQQELFGAEPTIYTVTSLTAAIHRVLSSHFDDVRVMGEISGYKVWTSGHAYFTLKDNGAQIRCVLFRQVLRYLKFTPGDGMAVVARGAVEVRQERGEYQLIVTSLEPQGTGALQVAFEQLKQKLAAEGLFDPERKRPLPPYPRRIGIVTSPQGAVIQDMLNILGRRFPGLHIRLYPTPVQGEGAVEGIVEGLRYFSEHPWADVVIVGRGGGSLEDLWAFNEEAVARAIASSKVPVISAVGHETDFTIADFVADLRAPTPSAAAELVVKNRADLLRQLADMLRRVWRAVQLHTSTARSRLQERGVDRAAMLARRRVALLWQLLDEADQRLRRADPRARLAAGRAMLDQLDRRAAERIRVLLHGHRLNAELLASRLPEAVQRHLEAARQRERVARARLEALSPLSVLERGYAIVRRADGRIVRQAADAPAGTKLRIRLRRDELGAVSEPTGNE
jgi:exodeoxyribonuclease VII large subunit